MRRTSARRTRRSCSMRGRSTIVYGGIVTWVVVATKAAPTTAADTGDTPAPPEGRRIQRDRDQHGERRGAQLRRQDEDAERDVDQRAAPHAGAAARQARRLSRARRGGRCTVCRRL